MSRIIALLLLGVLVGAPVQTVFARTAPIPVPTWWWRDNCLGCSQSCWQGTFDCPCWKYVWINTGA